MSNLRQVRAAAKSAQHKVVQAQKRAGAQPGEQGEQEGSGGSAGAAGAAGGEASQVSLGQLSGLSEEEVAPQQSGVMKPQASGVSEARLRSRSDSHTSCSWATKFTTRSGLENGFKAFV